MEEEPAAAALESQYFAKSDNGSGKAVAAVTTRRQSSGNTGEGTGKTIALAAPEIRDPANSGATGTAETFPVTKGRSAAEEIVKETSIVEPRSLTVDISSDASP